MESRNNWTIVQILTIVMLLHNTVNCTNLIISKPTLCGVLPNGVYGQLLSICSSIVLVAILSLFLHPQYEISLPCFSLYFFIPTFSGSSSQCKIIFCQCRVPLHYQFPVTLRPDTIKLCTLSIFKWRSVISLTFKYGMYIVLSPPPVYTC